MRFLTGQQLSDNITEGLTEDEISKLMSEVIKALEAECFEKNVWKVCHKVASRIDGEPAPCGHMAVHATQRTGKCYYLLHEFLLENGDHTQHMMYTDHQLSTTFLLLISGEHFF